MTYRALDLACECGYPARRFSKLGLTSEYELVIEWVCPGCRQLVQFVKTLADCCRECPEGDAVTPAEMAMTDARFLQSLGIRLEEGPVP